MAGMMATSTPPARSASAHRAGTVNESSYLPCRRPCVNPRTSGTVLRYCTTEMRSFFTGRDSREMRSISERKIVRRAIEWCKRFVRIGGFEHGETDARRDTNHRADGLDMDGVRAGAGGTGWSHCRKDQRCSEAGRLFQFVL